MGLVVSSAALQVVFGRIASPLRDSMEPLAGVAKRLIAGAMTTSLSVAHAHGVCYASAWVCYISCAMRPAQWCDCD
jgi:hypothetical protein